jgi:hypothetical protein
LRISRWSPQPGPRELLPETLIFKSCPQIQYFK